MCKYEASKTTYDILFKILENNYNKLFLIINKNSDELKHKFYDKLIEKVSDADKRGFIYGFRKRSDLNFKKSFWIKLGRTDRDNPTDRVIREWGGAVIFCLETPYNHKLEKLVHYTFNYAHKLRIENDKNEIEWFHFDEEIDILELVSKLNLLMEDFWYDEHVYNISSSTLLPSNTKRHWNHRIKPETDMTLNIPQNTCFIGTYLCCVPINCYYKTTCLCNPTCCLIKKSYKKITYGCYDCLPFCYVRKNNTIFGCSIIPFVSFIKKK